MSSQRIQIEQSKALEKITNENEFPTRMKSLIDELRVEKEKNTKIKEAFRTLDRNAKIQQ